MQILRGVGATGTSQALTLVDFRINLHKYFTTNLQHALFTKIMLHMCLHCTEIFQSGDGQTN